MQDEQECVILVDEADRTLQSGPKLGTHVAGQLHRAISVFVFDSSGGLLLQQRADCKYHSAKKWANTCCGHPRPNESCQDAAERRLFEEMGLDLRLTYGFKSRYCAHLDNGMVENEIPYLYFALSDKLPSPNPSEVQAYQVMSLEQLRREIDNDPSDYSAWLIHYMDSHQKRLTCLRDSLLSQTRSRQREASTLA